MRAASIALLTVACATPPESGKPNPESTGATPGIALAIEGLDTTAPLTAKAEATDELLTLTVEVEPPWHLYAPGAASGLPITMRVLPESDFAASGPLQVTPGPDGELHGSVEVELPLRHTGAAKRLRVEFGYQACDPQVCLPPAMFRIVRS